MPDSEDLLNSEDRSWLLLGQEQEGWFPALTHLEARASQNIAFSKGGTGHGTERLGHRSSTQVTHKQGSFRTDFIWITD